MGKLIQLVLPEGSTPLALIATAFFASGVGMRQVSLMLQKGERGKGKRLKRQLGRFAGSSLLETMWATMVGVGAGYLAGKLNQLPRTAVLG
jgi:hypothetical protein